MKQVQAYRFALRLKPAQEARLRAVAGSCRYVYNRALALERERFEAGLPHLSYYDLSRELTAWRADPACPWLAEYPRRAQEAALKDLARGYDNLFGGRADRPRFKKRGQHDAFRLSGEKLTTLDQGNARIRLTGIGWLHYRKSRVVEGIPKNVTVFLRAGTWYVSIQTEREVPEPVHPHPASAVGVDLGVAHFATLSDGTHIPALAPARRDAEALAKAQRSLARKKPGSKNRARAKARVARIQARIADRRSDYLHKLSHEISKNHALVVVEDLRVSSMTRSARGTIEEPGTNVAAKSGLNRAILDQGWGEFRRQLEYKCAWRGGTLVAVPAANTSRTCPACGHVSAENRRSQAVFACVSCGHAANADHVGALNVLRAGQARSACQVSRERIRPAAGSGKKARALACA